MNYQPLQKTGQETEYKKNPPLKISSIGTENSKKSSQMPDGSVLLTDTGNNSSLKNQGINYIIHAVPKHRNSCASDEEFIEIAVKAAQNSIFLADREGIDKLAICLIGGEAYRGSCDPKNLAEGIIRGAINQLEKCENLRGIILVDWGGNSQHYFLEKGCQLENELFMSGQTFFFEEDNHFGGSIKSDKSKGVEMRVGDICDKKLHKAEAIVNSENAGMEWGSGISGAIKEALGTEASNVDQQRKDLMRDFNLLVPEDNGGGGGTKYTCPQCGSEYNTQDEPLVGGKYCSKVCQVIAQLGNKTCAFCSKTIINFLVERDGKVYCSYECWNKQKKKEKPSEPTDNLTQTKKSVLEAIQTALNTEPKLNNSDLPEDYQNWESIIEQVSSADKINSLKEQILAIIKNRQQAKRASAERDQKINQAVTTEEKINLLKEMGNSLGEHTPEQTAKLEQVKNDLAANPAQLCRAIQFELASLMITYQVLEPI